MSASLAQRRVGECGFTLIETLVALALMGLVLSALANLTAQWLPNWNRGLERIQRSELIGISEQIHFGEPVLLLRAPFRLSFAYAGPDQVWTSSWHDSDKLPATIKLTVRDAASERILSISTVTPVHVQSPAQGDCAPPEGVCDGKSGAPKDSQGNAQEDSQANSQAGNAATGQGGRQ